MKWRYWIERPPAGFDIRDEIIFENVQLERGAHVLEVGVGLAGTTYKLASQVAAVTGVDISENLIRYLAGRQCVTNIRFLTADMCEPRALETLGTTFDLAISEDTLEHVEKPAGFFRTVAAALKPGTSFTFTFPNERAPSHGITRFHTLSELVELMHNAGFTAVNVFEVDLRSHARLVQAVLVDLPLRVLRSLRRTPKENPQVFHETWSFHARRKLEPLRGLLHAYWGCVRGLMKVSRPLYVVRSAGPEILGKRLLVVATKGS